MCINKKSAKHYFEAFMIFTFFHLMKQTIYSKGIHSGSCLIGDRLWCICKPPSNPLAIISSVFDHHPALHLVSLLPVSQKPRMTFITVGARRLLITCLARKVVQMLCTLSSQGQVLSWVVICLGYEGLKGRMAVTVCPILYPEYSSRVLCIWYF